MHKTVLIVDDNRMSRMLINTIIKAHHPAWTSIDVASKAEAFSKTAGKSIQLIIVNMNASGFDNDAIPQQLQQQFPTADIVLIAADDQQQARVDNFSCIVEPVTEDKLMNSLRLLD
ncbi:MAG: response regulator [Chromatiales bacterium]|jgi:DNA-binding NarL/FixJ family response regulator